MRRGGVWAEPALRAELVPDYEIGCKRALISNDYYPALLRPTVELVTDPIAEVRAHSVLTESGDEFACDAIIQGTGFSTHDFLAPMTVWGRDGMDLNEAWSEGANAYLGMTVHGFPNMFILYGPNTNLGGNSIIYMLESQIRHVLAGVSAVEGSGARAIEVSADAQSRMDATVQTALGRTVWNSGCTSWYVDETGRNTNNWPFTTLHYRRLASRVDMSDYVLDRGAREPRPEPVAA
jgi:cation diffusion facilitator CzcD-associated flavoprotein CzcO